MKYKPNKKNNQDNGFRLNVNTGHWRDTISGGSGDIVDLVCRLRGLNWEQAEEWIKKVLEGNDDQS